MMQRQGEPGQRVTFEYHRERTLTHVQAEISYNRFTRGLLKAIRSDDALAVKESFIREEHYEEDVENSVRTSLREGPQEEEIPYNRCVVCRL